jgi:hypothetical protein
MHWKYYGGWFPFILLGNSWRFVVGLSLIALYPFGKPVPATDPSFQKTFGRPAIPRNPYGDEYGYIIDAFMPRPISGVAGCFSDFS